MALKYYGQMTMSYMLVYFHIILANALQIISVMFQTFWHKTAWFCMQFEAHLSSILLLICLGLHVFSICFSESGGTRPQSEAVIWHVSECVEANQTEGPL